MKGLYFTIIGIRNNLINMAYVHHVERKSLLQNDVISEKLHISIIQINMDAFRISFFFFCYPLNVHPILYRVYGNQNDVTSHRKSISIIGYLELKIHDVVKFSFPFFLFSSLSYPATVPSNGENVVLNDVTIPRMETFPATRYVDYWNREWPNKHL